MVKKEDTKIYIMPIGMSLGLIIGTIIGVLIKCLSISLIVSTILLGGIGYLLDLKRK